MDGRVQSCAKDTMILLSVTDVRYRVAGKDMRASILGALAAPPLFRPIALVRLFGLSEREASS
jgi:hypothetical protein